jgi:hypothetical protein
MIEKSCVSDGRALIRLGLLGDAIQFDLNFWVRQPERRFSVS